MVVEVGVEGFVVGVVEGVNIMQGGYFKDVWFLEVNFVMEGGYCFIWRQNCWVLWKFVVVLDNIGQVCFGGVGLFDGVICQVYNVVFIGDDVGVQFGYIGVSLVMVDYVQYVV